MLISVKINNCFAFNEEVEFSLNADLRTKKFPFNYYTGDNVNILKSAVIYGPNNTGKTNFINCIRTIQATLLNEKNQLVKNLFNDNDVCSIEIKILHQNDIYIYSYKYDWVKDEYLYEKFTQLIFDEYKNEKEKIYFLRDIINNKFNCIDKKLEEILSVLSKDNILIYTLDSEKFSILDEIKNILVSFGEKIVVIDTNESNDQKEIEILKEKSKCSKKLVDLIKSADLYLDDVYYNDNDESSIVKNEKIPLKFREKFKLTSVYKNQAFPSIFFDSVGTKKFSYLASYIIDCLEDEKILFVDEIDSSLHFKLTRAIFSLYNNDINQKSQLICTSHDVSLLDCKRLFRKEQIWFTDKDDNTTKLYSLKNYLANEDGVRSDSDIYELYSKGLFAAIPEPNLMEIFDEE